MALYLQRLDELDHLGHPFRGVRLGEDRTGVEGDHVAVKPGGLLGGEFEEVNTEFPGLGEDGVVDVGDVAHQLHLMAEILEPANQEVIGEIGVRMAEVGGVVRGDTADVHLHLVSRFERDDLPAGRVEELHVGHGSHLRWRSCVPHCAVATARRAAMRSEGAPGRNRTCDARFRKPTLYPLSYGGGDGAKRGAKLRCWVRPHVGLRLSACFRARCGLRWWGSLGAVFV